MNAQGADEMAFTVKSIGFIRTDSDDVPRHWTVSDLEGVLEIDKAYLEGLKDIKQGDRIVVIFYFHKSSEFSSDLLIQTPRSRKGERVGVFSICSPLRPNPIGMSVFDVLWVRDNSIGVKGIDAFDGTPILDIKPYIVEE